MTRPTRRASALALQAFAREGKALPAFVEKDASRKTGPRGKDRKHEEDDLHVSIVKMLKLLPGTLYWHTPSSFYRGPNSTDGFFGYIAKLKAKGWYAGIPDLCVLFKNIHGATTVVFAELKKPKGGTVSDTQELFLDKANGIGCYTAKVRDLGEMRGLLGLAGHPAFSTKINPQAI